MNNHDIDTGLPYVAFCRVSDIDPHESHHRQLGVSADTRLYTEDQVRAAIEADRKRRGEPVAWTLTQQEVIALAEELIVGASTLGGMDDDGIECDVRLMVRMPGTIADDDGKPNDKSILAFCLDDYPEEGVYPIDPAECKLQAAPQPAEPCVAPVSGNPVCVAQNAECETQAAEPMLTSGKRLSDGSYEAVPAEPSRGGPVAYEIRFGSHMTASVELTPFPARAAEARALGLEVHELVRQDSVSQPAEPVNPNEGYKPEYKHCEDGKVVWTNAADAPVVKSAEPVKCPDPSMGEHACSNRAQCWEPCGELGSRVEHARVAEPVKEIELRAEDLHISTYSPTHRPQWAAHNDRGVRIVHLPTGTVAESHEERSPHRNQKIALDRLRQAIADEPVKVPSDAQLKEFWRQLTEAGGDEVDYARALLNRYGQTAQPAASAEPVNVSEARKDAKQELLSATDKAYRLIANSEAPQRFEGIFGRDAEPVKVPECSCEACQPNTWGNVRMIVCAICGNKRCPHATDHRNHCTGSNEPGQKGSSYEHCTDPAPAQPAPANDNPTPEEEEAWQRMERRS